jgi:hypothetical protein
VELGSWEAIGPTRTPVQGASYLHEHLSPPIVRQPRWSPDSARLLYSTAVRAGEPSTLLAHMDQEAASILEPEVPPEASINYSRWPGAGEDDQQEK